MTLPKKKNGRRLNSFERFTALTEAYDGLLKNFKELRVAALCPANTWLCSGYVRYLIKTLDVDLEAEARALWPHENIHAPSLKFITQRLGLMVGATPHGRPHSPEVFGKMLATYVAAEHPSAMVLESTCREIETSVKFVASIPEGCGYCASRKKSGLRGLK